MDYQRKYHRVGFREGIQYSINNTRQKGNFLSCNISEGGIRCYSNAFLPVNTEIGLSFYLSAEQFIGINGRIVWIQKVPHAENYQLGIEFFHDIEGFKEREKINKLVESSQE